MATWPTLDELKARLDVTSNDFDGELTSKLAAAIDQTKARVGDWVEGVDAPDDALAQSALERAIGYGMADGTAFFAKADRLLAGHRRRFGFA